MVYNISTLTNTKFKMYITNANNVQWPNTIFMFHKLYGYILFVISKIKV